MAFHTHWQDHLGEVLADKKGPGFYSQQELDDYKSFLQANNIGLPEEGDISLGEALLKARETLLALANWSEKTFDAYQINSIYIFSPKFNQNVYRFFITLGNPGKITTREQARAFMAEQDALLKESFGSYDDAPWPILITLDPKTGSLMEEPVVYHCAAGNPQPSQMGLLIE